MVWLQGEGGLPRLAIISSCGALKGAQQISTFYCLLFPSMLTPLHSIIISLSREVRAPLFCYANSMFQGHRELRLPRHRESGWPCSWDSFPLGRG